MSTLAMANMSFWNWSQHLLKLNCLLCGTPSAFNNNALHNHLEAHLDNELKSCLRNSDAQKDRNLKTWMAAIHLMDKARTVENKCQHELIEETLEQQAKCQNTRNNTLHGPSHCANSSQSNVSTSPSTLIRLPPLTDSEHTLLNEHNSCTKCHKFYVGHHSHMCPNGFPQGKGYKTLTVGDALAAKKEKATTKPSAKHVTSTSSKVETVDSDEGISAATVILLDSPGEYKSDSSKVWELLEHEVSPPIRTKHLIMVLTWFLFVLNLLNKLA